MLKEYLIWLRNGVAFTYSWLVLMSLLWQLLAGADTLTISYLIKLLVLVIAGCGLFNLCFMKNLLKKKSFYGRMNLFFAGIVLLQLVGAYWMGLFHNGIGSFSNWLIYSGIVCILYGISSLLYGRYRNNQSALYTDHLASYLSQKKE